MKQDSSKRIKSVFYEKNHLNFVVTLIVISLNSVLIVGLSYFLQKATDLAIEKNLVDMQAIVVGGLLTIGCLVINWLIERIAKNNFLERAERQYKEMVFEHLMQKNISAFMSENTSSYVSGMTNDLNTIEMHYLMGTFDLILQILFFCGALGMMIWYSVTLTFLALILICLCGFVSFIIGKKLVIEERKVSMENETFVFSLKNLLGGYHVIKSFKAEKSIARLFAEQNGKLEKQKCKRRKMESLINLIASGTGLLVQTGVIFFGARLAIEGELTIGALVAFVQLMGIILGPIQLIPKLYSNRKAANALIHKIEISLAENVESNSTETIKDLEQGIEYKHVSFSYEPNNIILHNINLKFEKNKSYLIVGGSGCGKSTLLNLLLGGYDNYEGSILVGGTELSQISKDMLYDTISFISQNSFIFDGTIKENITMFSDDSFHNLDSVLKASGLNKVIEEKGIDYECGENGTGLSGGERQRIAIARCLLMDNPILIMDEGTASLDIDTAFSVENSILDIEQLTRIVITHRLHESLLKRYDEIIILKDGRIVEQGDYDTLIQNKGHLYYMIANK